MSETSHAAEVLPPPGWQFKIGLVFFVLCWTSPLFVPLVAMTDLPLAWKSVLSGALVLGGPEVFGPFLLQPFIFYAPHLVPLYDDHRVVFGIVLDLSFVISFFILGGAFWDKVRALFVHGATAQFPEKTGA